MHGSFPTSLFSRIMYTGYDWWASSSPSYM
jgi:hypothetical protein